MSKSSTTTQENNPPDWAEPLLKTGAADALSLYNADSGYHAYTGPTQAGLSDVTLGAMNNALKATGYTGPAVTNETWQNNSAVQDAKKMLEDMIAQKSSQQTQTTQQTTSAEPSWVSQFEDSTDRWKQNAAQRYRGLQEADPSNWMLQEGPETFGWNSDQGSVWNNK